MAVCVPKDVSQATLTPDALFYTAAHARHILPDMSAAMKANESEPDGIQMNRSWVGSLVSAVDLTHCSRFANRPALAQSSGSHSMHLVRLHL